MMSAGDGGGCTPVTGVVGTDRIGMVPPSGPLALRAVVGVSEGDVVVDPEPTIAVERTSTSEDNVDSPLEEAKLLMPLTPAPDDMRKE